MIQPINYLGAIQNARPTQGFGELGQIIALKRERDYVNSQRELQENIRAQAMQKEQAKQNRKNDFRVRFKEISDEGTYSDEKFNSFRANFPGEISAIDNMAKRFKFQSEENAKNVLTRVKMAAKKGPEGLKFATKILEEYELAHKGNNDSQTSQMFAQLKQGAIDGDYEGFIEDVNLVGGSLVSDWFKPSKESADVKNIQSTIRERDAKTKEIESDSKIARDKIKFDMGISEAKMKQLNPIAQKIVNDSATKAVDKYSLADRSEKLAIEYDSLIKSSGLYGKTLAFARKNAGFQTKEDEIRTTYKSLKSKGIVESLPPGIASDTDIKMVSDGFPDDDANSEILSSFLRGLAKIQRYEGQKEEVKAQWAEKNTLLGASKNDSTIYGISVPEGMTYPQFIKKHGDDIYKKEFSESKKDNGITKEGVEEATDFVKGLFLNK